MHAGACFRPSRRIKSRYKNIYVVGQAVVWLIIACIRPKVGELYQGTGLYIHIN